VTLSNHFLHIVVVQLNFQQFCLDLSISVYKLPSGEMAWPISMKFGKHNHPSL